MQLPAVPAVLLIAAGIWSLVVWPPFLRRVLKDPRARDPQGRATRFLMVHLVLVSVSMLLGLATAVIGLLALVG